MEIDMMICLLVVLLCLDILDHLITSNEGKSKSVAFVIVSDWDSRDTLLEGEGEFGDFLAELGEGDAGGGGGFGEEGGFGHAGDGVGFEDVGAVLGV
jgi:hypothetical protein